MAKPNPLVLELHRALARISDLERRMANTIRHGTVEVVDTEKKRMRLKIGTDVDGTPQLGPWIRYGQHAGAMKAHIPPTKGQNFTQISPGGDFEQAVAVPLSWNKANESPSNKGDENVFTYGAFKAEIRGDELVVSVPTIRLVSGSTSVILTDGSLTLIADDIQENP